MKRLGCKCVLLVIACTFFSCTVKTEGIRIAVPDDLCGILGYYMVRNKQLENTEMAEEVFPLMDCCNTTTEWALTSKRIDVAWLCPDAARNLLEKDKRFLIVGPALVNSQILVIRQSGKPKRIAYSHKREHQKAFIQKRYGTACEAIPVMPSALPYIYEQGNVDGIVIDALKGMTLKGKYMSLASDNTEVITYVLVMSRDFRNSGKYSRFLAALKDAATELNESETLTKVLGQEKKMTPMQVKQIISLGARFIPPKIP